MTTEKMGEEDQGEVGSSLRENSRFSVREILALKTPLWATLLGLLFIGFGAGYSRAVDINSRDRVTNEGCRFRNESNRTIALGIYDGQVITIDSIFGALSTGLVDYVDTDDEELMEFFREVQASALDALPTIDLESIIRDCNGPDFPAD